MDDSRSMESRVTTVETELKTVVSSIQQLTDTVDKNSQQMWGTFDRLKESIAGLRDAILQRDKPNYSVVISAASFGLAFVIAIGGAAFTPLHVRLNYMEAQGLQTDAVLNHRIDQVVGHFDGDMQDLDTLFQREMRDLDARIVDRVDHNERWLEKLIDREITKGDKARGIGE